ncbi:hypothetical protein YPPY66_2026 [Yersinia pestis PY-66]|nr:hypothetical protein YpK1973002_0960 [Yersinia pestis biovar Mediaevalis str. K1973002]EIR22156.1 hypothetical protein YPPY09_1861 [Yersinia pestis PY-09]EIR35461.1 hypothetical protein YPPY11_1926 [Yersinia pestis PY-11]EIR48863.1 hypothetical protein YPPY15_1810 [Yersinia pestis PY-15]EIR50808.1 hypothetical protein YPPY14_1806 [Yersinia pestis PY-14]EIR66598.1 hypothetical protein YPPY25_1851 [Yersinia pestis PY-25]EIR78584.1 hypothetical protein YPPY34_1818 [Yersinia pestis PY-34]EIS1
MDLHLLADNLAKANVCAQQLVSCAIYRTNHYPADIILS